LCASTSSKISGNASGNPLQRHTVDMRTHIHTHLPQPERVQDHAAGHIRGDIQVHAGAARPACWWDALLYALAQVRGRPSRSASASSRSFVTPIMTSSPCESVASSTAAADGSSVPDASCVTAPYMACTGFRSCTDKLCIRARLGAQREPKGDHNHNGTHAHAYVVARARQTLASHARASRRKLPRDICTRYLLHSAPVTPWTKTLRRLPQPPRHLLLQLPWLCTQAFVGGQDNESKSRS
jgi:hypothetical protein